jgi:hypothetical protein
VKSLVRALTLVAFTAQLVGCASTRIIPAEAELSNLKRAKDHRGMRIAGYTTADGVQHPFWGFVQPIADDRLSFERAPARSTESIPEAERSFTLPRQDVTAFQIDEIDKGRTFRFLAVVLGTIAFIQLVTGLFDFSGFN